jgi:hypothetical protein
MEIIIGVVAKKELRLWAARFRSMKAKMMKMKLKKKIEMMSLTKDSKNVL